MKKRILGIIPARLNSTRLPRKMLAMIKGKPLLYWTWLRTQASTLIDEVIVATDSNEIVEVVHGFGGHALLTSSKHGSGSDRAAEVAAKTPWARIVVNIQGDEPLLSPAAIDAAISLLLDDHRTQVATVATPFSVGGDVSDIGAAKVVLDRTGHALLFSRSTIPYARNAYSGYLKHIGLYAFRRSFLATYANLPRTSLEEAESLEQLRILEHGYRIRVAVGRFTSIGVDTPSDLARVRRLISSKKID